MWVRRRGNCYQLLKSIRDKKTGTTRQKIVKLLSAEEAQAFEQKKVIDRICTFEEEVEKDLKTILEG